MRSKIEKIYRHNVYESSIIRTSIKGNTMNAYKKYVTIDNSQQLILSDLPFKPGQKVEVIILTEEAQEIQERFRELQQQIEIGTQQIEAGKVTDGEIVFEQIKGKLRQDYGVE